MRRREWCRWQFRQQDCRTVGAAPHLPAGILSPYSDGERGAVANGFANRQGRGGAGGAPSPFSPSLYGE
ncbi:hypothetical protein EN826_034445, partial [Mesorhizobium sp. M1D.F.Ca.ET.183.01.1.1]